MYNNDKKNYFFVFNLNEENNLVFKNSLLEQKQYCNETVFRLVVHEKKENKFWLYPAHVEKNGNVSISIPPNDSFSEGRDYNGYIEAITNNHYSTPINVKLEFISTTPSPNKSKPSPSQVRTTNIPTPTWEKLTENEKSRIKSLLIKRKTGGLREEKKVTKNTKSEKDIKANLKQMMLQSLQEE